MSNYFNNRVSVKLSPKDLQNLHDDLSNFEKKMPFGVGLTSDERMRMLKIRRSNKLFVEEALAVAKEFPDLMPVFLTAEELEKDFTLHVQLDGLEKMILSLLKMVQDTRIISGAEAIQAALMIYKLVKIAAAAGMPKAQAAYERLAIRFEEQGNFSTQGDEDQEGDPQQDTADQNNDTPATDQVGGDPDM